jgi:hypothetical protein
MAQANVSNATAEAMKRLLYSNRAIAATIFVPFDAAA